MYIEIKQSIFTGKQNIKWSEVERFINSYATIIVRINDTGLYLHDIINIKKEASKPTDS